MKYIKEAIIVILVIVILLLSKCSSDYKHEVTMKNEYIEYLENNNKSLNISIDSTKGVYLSREKALVMERDDIKKLNKDLYKEIDKLKKLTGNDQVIATDIVIENETSFNDTILLRPDVVFIDEYISPLDSLYKPPYTVYYKIYYSQDNKGIIIDTIKSEHKLKMFLDENANVNVITENGTQVMELDSYLDPKQLKKLAKKYSKQRFNLGVGFGVGAVANKNGVNLGPCINLSVNKTIVSW